MKSFNLLQLIHIIILFLVSFYYIAAIRSLTPPINDNLTYGGLIRHRRPTVCVPSFPHTKLNFKSNSSISDSFIEASYVYWLYSAGANVVPIHPWFNTDKVKKTFSRCNGLLIQNLVNRNNSTADDNYFYFVKKLYDDIKYMNEIGIYFPVFAIGLGSDLIQMIESNSTDILNTTNFDNADKNMTRLELLIKDAKKIRMMTYFDGRDINNINSKSIFPHFNYYGVSPEAYNTFPKLKNIFKVLALGVKNENKYIAMIEAYRYPIYGISFDPARYIYDRKNDNSLLDYSNEAITICQKILNFFVSESFKNLFNRVKDLYTKKENELITVKLFEKVFKGIDIHTASQIKVDDGEVLNGYFYKFSYGEVKTQNHHEKTTNVSVFVLNNTNHTFLISTNSKNSTTSKNSTQTVKRKKKKKKKIHNITKIQRINDDVDTISSQSTSSDEVNILDSFFGYFKKMFSQ